MMSPTHPQRRWATLLWLLAMPLAQAASPAPQCGTFQAEGGSEQLQVRAPGHAELRSDYSAPRPVALQQIDGQLQQVDLENGLLTPLQVQDNGRRLVTGDARYTLQSPQRCQAVAAAAPGSCLADAAQCLAARRDATPAALQAGCHEGVPGLCLQLLDRWREEATVRNAPDADAQRALVEAALAGIQLPAACRDGGFEQERPACRAAVDADPALQKQIVSAVMGVAMAQAMAAAAAPGPTPPLPAERRAQLLQLCRQVPNATFCGRVAEAEWDAGGYGAALEALGRACAPGGAQSACQALPGLRTVQAALQPQPATALPCGAFKADHGLMDTLAFGDDGLVGVGFGSTLRARVENGDIRIRHDKGGDFVLRPLPGGALLGLDAWTRYQVFTATGDGQAQCRAARAFTVVPLPQDCPAVAAPGGAAQCCTQGKLQGCNALGNQLALQGQWQQAATHYTTVCRAGVREGCENLASVQENSGKVDAKAVLEQICASDPGGRHTACDLLQTRNWALMEFGQALQDTLRDAGNSTAPPPTQHRSNRKR